MTINETSSYSAQITIKDNNGMDVPAVFLSANLDTNMNNFNISANINAVNKALLTDTATNSAGETVQAQYLAFETEVKARAKDLGYAIF